MKVTFLPDISVFAYALKKELKAETLKEKELKRSAKEFLNFIAKERAGGSEIAFIPKELREKMKENWFSDTPNAMLVLDSLVETDDSTYNKIDLNHNRAVILLAKIFSWDSFPIIVSNRNKLKEMAKNDTRKEYILMDTNKLMEFLKILNFDINRLKGFLILMKNFPNLKKEFFI